MLIYVTIYYMKVGAYMLLKDKIKQLRKDRGLTQASLGKLINKSSQVISNWERGYTSSINQDDIKRLANA